MRGTWERGNEGNQGMRKEGNLEIGEPGDEFRN